VDTIRITKDWRITIPPKYRDLLHIRPGQKVDVTVSKGGIITLEFLPFEEQAPAPKRHLKRAAPNATKPGSEVVARP
jgi:AbrB family looped-hinge helix DNA binding protein